MSLDTLAQEVRWVAWRNEPRGKKYSKVPYAPNGRRAKSDYPTTWGTRAEAEAIAGRLVNGQGGGIGIQLGDLGHDVHLAGIDLDCCLGEGGTLAPWAAAILDLVPTYAEVSPSRRGLKLFFYVASEDFRPFLDRIGAPPHQWGVRRDVPGEDARDHGPAIEVYFSHRYFTVTRMQWATAPNRLIMLDCDALERLATLIPPARLGADRRGNGSADNSRSAIAFRKGAALRREGKTFEQMCEALRVDTETAGWVREKGDANDGRELHRIWEKAQASIGTSAPKRKHALGGGLATPGRLGNSTSAPISRSPNVSPMICAATSARSSSPMAISGSMRARIGNRSMIRRHAELCTSTMVRSTVARAANPLSSD